jgi:hypothetical protein
MAKTTPIVRSDTLVYQQHEHEQVLVVGTPSWYAWLETASSFAFRSDAGTFTARKERAGNQRGSWYWKAYRMHHGKLSSLYLGKSETLSLERLHAVAGSLARLAVADREVGRAANRRSDVPRGYWAEMCSLSALFRSNSVQRRLGALAHGTLPSPKRSAQSRFSGTPLCSLVSRSLLSLGSARMDQGASTGSSWLSAPVTSSTMNFVFYKLSGKTDGVGFSPSRPT